MSCQSSVPPVMWSRKVGKISKPIVFNLGLLCSKTFDDAIFEELFLAKYGLRKAEMVKMNIKGVFQIWMRDGSYHEINLKECHAWTRDGCTHCPDFAAEHADISCGGIGENADWTLTIVRTDLGREIITRMIDAGVIESRPGDSDPGGDRPHAQAGREVTLPVAGVGRTQRPGRTADAEAEDARLTDVDHWPGPAGPNNYVFLRQASSTAWMFFGILMSLPELASDCCCSNFLASSNGTLSTRPL